jgi:hypothetical protein
MGGHRATASASFGGEVLLGVLTRLRGPSQIDLHADLATRSGGMPK